MFGVACACALKGFHSWGSCFRTVGALPTSKSLVVGAATTARPLLSIFKRMVVLAEIV